MDCTTNLPFTRIHTPSSISFLHVLIMPPALCLCTTRSMGGMLACGLLSQQGKYASILRSAALVGSGCFGDGSWHAVLKPLVKPIIRLGFPAGTAGQGLALLADTPAALTLFEVSGCGSACCRVVQGACV